LIIDGGQSPLYKAHHALGSAARVVAADRDDLHGDAETYGGNSIAWSFASLLPNASAMQQRINTELLS
jgi:hypothetical protein